MARARLPVGATDGVWIGYENPPSPRLPTQYNDHSPGYSAEINDSGVTPPPTHTPSWNTASLYISKGKRSHFNVCFKMKISQIIKPSQTWRIPSSGMLRRVALVRTDVSEVLSTSCIRVTRIGELETTLAITSNRRVVTWGFHGCDYEECRLLVRYAVWLLWEPKFRRNVLLPSSG
jgi:hypothetical protein